MVLMISLNRNFRSHTILAACLSHASCDDQLQPAVNPIDRTILTGSPMQLLVQTCPLVLIRDDTIDVLDLCKSRHNEGHHQITQKMLDAMVTCSYSEHITIVVLYFLSGNEDDAPQITATAERLRGPYNRLLSWSGSKEFHSGYDQDYQ